MENYHISKMQAIAVLGKHVDGLLWLAHMLGLGCSKLPFWFWPCATLICVSTNKHGRLTFHGFSFFLFFAPLNDRCK